MHSHSPPSILQGILTTCLLATVMVAGCLGSDDPANSDPPDRPDVIAPDAFATGDVASPDASTSNFDTGVSGDTGGTGGDTGVEPWQSPDVCEPLAERTAPEEADIVVGDGTPSSCTATGLRSAIDQPDDAAVIRLDCGEEASIDLAEPIVLRRDLTLIGTHDVTLAGSGEQRLFIAIGSATGPTPHLKLQNLTLTGGGAPANGLLPDIEEYTGSGGAILGVRAEITVLNSVIRQNRGAARGPDVAGGAIYSVLGERTVIDDSYLAGNAASNGGAIGQLQTPLTIADSVISNNQATGTGGNPGNGGNGGGIYMDGVGHSLSICGTIVKQNEATAFGGGVFRVSNEQMPDTSIRRSAIRDNNVYETDPSLGGGLYLQGTEIDIARVSLTANRAGGAGALFVGPGSSLRITNATIAENVATRGLGGGLSMSNDTEGVIRHATIARNRASHSTGFAAALHRGANVMLENSIIAGHAAGNTYSPLSCRPGLTGGAGTIQSPQMRDNDAEEPPCAPEVTFADPMLGPLSTSDAVGRSLQPSPESPAVGFATDCPDLDQRGQPRPTPCTAGAIETRRTE